MEGDSLDYVDSINALFMLFCTSLLPLVVIGIGFFYSGLTQRRASLTMFALPLLLTPLIFIDWFIWGYSLCYSSSSNRFIGNLKFAVLRQLRDPEEAFYTASRGTILGLNHFLFNGFFKVICAAITFPGCVAERGRLIPMGVFLFFWSAIIYNPVTYWFWNHSGWLSIELGKLPVLDFAGGTCVHIVSGFTTLAYSYILGPRNPKLLYNYRNSNTGYAVLGSFFVTCGWMGFIAGCDFKFSSRTLYIIVNTFLCALTSGIVWSLIDYYFSSIPLDGSVPIEQYGPKSNVVTPYISQTGVQLNQHLHESKSNFTERRKLSMISFSSGIMTGLVVITPAGGYISSATGFWKSFVFGVIGAILCNLSTRLKYFVRIDDALDIFAIHGVAGIVGSLLTGLFSSNLYETKGGWVEANWIQLGYQILGSVVASSYVFILTCVLLYIIDLIPGLHLRIDKDFNRRAREKQSDPKIDAESQLSPTNVSNIGSEISYYEKAELMGTDSYEFNGEYMLDFMEFIRVISPNDFADDDLIIPEEYHAHYDNVQAQGSDFEMHSEAANLTKRE
ncbi:putative ammonium transporter [Suhomyces tanzawaensis NRRL Y-17324]|uniref:Putative ammonium transporter n=1 Tax=Suhomyces tanzawaensis NRRL Y-17324 TaxID=984487 RepID=A0A1E4SMV3_9ASCO|nr:putative ammonium transporter [Suhomyces tanzawaensis NRRL Y-17324]ODV80850.1 putative ammonium transporter [Suhomyces tanzawaensis NRRL Y-17324]